MRVTVCVLACCLSAGAALTAPVPRPRDHVFFQLSWDRPVDPDGDCKFTAGRDALTVEVPAKPHLLTSYGRGGNAPRLLRSVTGDFVIQVRVRGPFHATAKPTDRRPPSHTAAGLIIEAGGRDHRSFRLDFGAARYKDLAACVGQVHQVATGARGSWAVEGLTHWQLPRGAKSAYLRIERRGEAIHPGISADGKKWFLQPWFKLKYPDTVKVGLIATSTSDAPLKVTFDQFKLTRLAPATK